MSSASDFVALIDGNPVLLYIILIIDNSPTVVYIDTCASTSLTSLKGSNPCRLSTPIPIRGVGGTLNIYEQTHISFTIGSIPYTILVNYSEIFSKTLLLGNDLLLKVFKPLINYTDSCIKFGDTVFPFFRNDTDAHHALYLLTTIPGDLNTYHPDPGLPIKVVVKETVMVPPGNQFEIEVRLLTSQDNLPPCMFEFDTRFSEQHILLAHDLYVQPDIFSALSVTNITPRSRRVNVGTLIGYLHKIQEVYEVTEHIDSDIPDAATVPRRETQMTSDQLKLLNINPDLPHEQRSQLTSLLSQHADVFSWTDEHIPYLGPMPDGVKLVDVGDAQPISCRPYKSGFQEQQFVDEQVQTLLKRGIIQHSNTPWTAPVVLAKKPDGTWRFCVAYVKLNAISKTDNFPMSVVQDIFQTLHNASWFSTADLRDGFYTLPLTPEQQQYTGFVTHSGIYHFRFCPFGLKNSPAWFLRIINRAFRDYAFGKRRFIFLYIDDFLVFSTTFANHLTHLLQVFLRLRRLNLCLKATKCFFSFQRVKCLGYIVTPRGFEPDPAKISAVQDFPRPRTAKDVRSFLGLASYYRRWVPSFSDIGRPLHALTGKNVRFVWSEDCQASFDYLKKLLSSSPILAPYDPSKPIELLTDASDFGLGVIMGQRNDENVPQVLAYASQLMSSAQRNYSTTDKELLGIIFGLEHFRPYCFGTKVKVITDHHSLCHLRKFKKVTGRLARWLLLLSEYDFEVVYRKGEGHPPDCLSRLFPDNAIPYPEGDEVFYNEEEDFRSQLIREVVSDPQYKKVVEQLKTSPTPAEITNSTGFYLLNDILYYHNSRQNKRVIAVPKTCVGYLLHVHHSSIHGGHLGANKVLSKLRTHYYWPGMAKDIRAWVKGCVVCAQIKSRCGPGVGELHSLQIPGQPFETIAFDLIGPISPASTPGMFSFIAVAIDLLTRFVVAEPLRLANAETLARFLLNHIYFSLGSPTTLICDNASINRSHLVAALTAGLGTKVNFAAPYNHQSNLTERMNRTLENVLASLVQANPNHWHPYIRPAIYTINTTVCMATNCTPFYLAHGWNPRSPLESQFPVPDLPGDYIERVQSAREVAKFSILDTQQRHKQTWDKSHRPINYKVGDLVFVEYPNLKATALSTKLQPKYLGIYEITGLLSDLNCKVRPLHTTQAPQTVNIRRLKRFEPRGADLTFTPTLSANLIPTPVAHATIEEIPDSSGPPDSAVPTRTAEDTAAGIVRTRYGRTVKPPNRMNL